MEPQQTQQPQQQQVPQYPTNGPQPTPPASAPVQHGNGMKKTLITVLVLAVLVGLGYYLLKGQNTAAPTDESQVQSNATVNQATTDTELTQLEEENNNQDFSEIETDFGADVNAAAQ